MRIWPPAEPWPGVALVLLLAMMSASSPEYYQDLLAYLAEEDALNASSLEPVAPCTPHTLLKDLFREYTSVPRYFLTVARHNACRGLGLDNQGAPQRDYSDHQPQWLNDATTAGDCPWHLVRKEFMHGTLPAAILEVSCLCDGLRCSLQGDFRCISVTRQVKVWSSGASGGADYQPHFLEVTTACVCAQRHALQGDHVHPGP